VPTETIEVAGLKLEVFRDGAGPTLLVLHEGGGFNPDAEIITLLAKHRSLICPSHPGFGKSDLPDWVDSVDDIAHVHLELLDKLGVRQTEMLGISLGGWVAAEMATRSPERFTKLILVGAVGVKTGPADCLDIPDVFAFSPAELERALYHNPEKMRVDLASLPDDRLATIFRNREATALYVWEPYMHNPKLKHRLRRVSAPTLFLRGASDGLVSHRYMASYAELFPNARTGTIEAAGHLPHLEQPSKFAEHVTAFLAN
jgi:pimeloyl-ACP methyl ester carboxylesterase